MLLVSCCFLNISIFWCLCLLREMTGLNLCFMGFMLGTDTSWCHPRIRLLEIALHALLPGKHKKRLGYFQSMSYADQFFFYYQDEAHRAYAVYQSSVFITRICVQLQILMAEKKEVTNARKKSRPLINMPHTV